MEVSDPGFDGIKAHSFGHHVLAHFTPHVKRGLIPDLTSSHSLPLNDHKGFLLGKVAFFGDDFGGVKVFGAIESISPGCG